MSNTKLYNTYYYLLNRMELTTPLTRSEFNLWSINNGFDQEKDMRLVKVDRKLPTTMDNIKWVEKGEKRYTDGNIYIFSKECPNGFYRGEKDEVKEMLRKRDEKSSPNYYNTVIETKLYRTYRNILNRCYNENNPEYKWYGAKGIRMCDEWRDSFHRFAKWSYENGFYKQDNPSRKETLSIDRIDPSGDYSPSNCNWITLSENASRGIKKSWEEGRIKGRRGFTSSECAKGGKMSAKKVLQIDQTTNEVVSEYESATEASKKIGRDVSAITGCCRGRSKTCANYKWEYAVSE